MALALASLAGCASDRSFDAARTIAVTLTLVDDVRAQCGGAFLETLGCAKVRGDTCEIVASRPRSFDDRGRIQTLGHELFHCLVGPVHM